jgi:DNA-binding CsgD family transcriptional regulator
MLAQCVPVYFFEGQSIVGLLIIFTFFTGNGFLPFYFMYGTQLQVQPVEATSSSLSLEEFCLKYDVSPRETDIVREICNGLSNKEISEKLFISLQTVKDHTHRIYIKTNVRSRAQLMNLVKGAGSEKGLGNSI